MSPEPTGAESLEALLEQLVPGSTRRRRGRPRNGFARAQRHAQAVQRLMWETGVNVTQAVETYAAAAKITPRQVWAALRRYWAE